MLRDPGTYLYGASKDWRNRFRSVEAHATVAVEGVEQNDWAIDRSSFSVLKNSHCTVLKFHNRGIVLRVQYHNVEHIRNIRILDDAIEVTDSCNKPFTALTTLPGFMSVGYGKRLTSPA